MEEFQTLLANHGLLIVAIAVLLDQVGIPIPAPPTLILAGGLIGAGDLSLPSTLAVATLAALPPDLAWFELGRRRGHKVLRLLCKISLEPDSCVRSTRESFSNRGPATLLFSKFVPGLQTIAPPMAGASGMSYGRFLAYDLPGALIWSLAFLLGGALLSEQIDQVLTALQGAAGPAGILLLLSLVAWIAWKAWNRQRFLRTLRTLRIEPDALHSLFEEDPAPLIYDLRHPAQIESDGARIPGSTHLDLSEIDTRHEEIPRDREIVLYCT